MTTAKLNLVSVLAQLPEDLLVPFLQHIRDFDMEHDPLHEDKVMLVYFVQGGMTTDKFHEMCQNINPPIEGPITYIQLE